MKKIIGIIIAIVVIGFFVHLRFAEKAKREAKQAAENRLAQARKAEVSEMVSKANAVEDWESHLVGSDRFRLKHIMTFELERLWLQSSPILFHGAITDIAMKGESQYVILIDRGLLASRNYFFLTELQLSLVARKDIIDSFLEEYPDILNGFGVRRGVALVARIQSISARYVRGEDCVGEQVKIGNGELIDIRFTGELLL